MCDERSLEALDVVHGHTGHPGALHAVAVIGERHGALGGHVTDLGELLARLTCGDRADGVHAHDAFRRRALNDEAHLRAAVADRLGVGHACHGSEPAVSRRTRTARDRLLVLLTRLAQVHVDVGQSGQDHLLGAVDHLGAGRLQILAHPGDDAVLHEHVEHRIQLGRSVDHTSTLKQQCHCPHLPASDT